MASALEKLAARNTKVPAAPDFPEREIPLNKILFDKKQPRQSLHPLDGVLSDDAQQKIDEMVESIKLNGQIQAITVLELPDGNFLVVVGETRTRAFMKLGRVTIRATVRNDLETPTQLLIYRLAENINRNDLTPDELAHSVRVLMEGNDEIPPMSQVEIAKKLAKPQDWVTRYARYGDAEVQRLWVKTKIADTVEKAYRISNLPMRVQLEIQRRAKLPKKDPEHLSTPLLRSVIDEFAKEARIANPSAKVKATGGAPARFDEQTFGLRQDVDGAADEVQSGQVGSTDHADPLDHAFIAAAADGQPKQKQGPYTAPGNQSAYTLDPSARAALLGQAHAHSVPAAQLPSGKAASAVRVAPVAPVNCRVQFGVLGALLMMLGDDKELKAAFQNVQCELAISGPVAGQLANLLAGIVVDPAEVPAYLTNALPKLGQA